MTMYCEECELHVNNHDEDDEVCPQCGGELITEDQAADNELDRNSLYNTLATRADFERDQRLMDY